MPPDERQTGALASTFHVSDSSFEGTRIIKSPDDNGIELVKVHLLKSVCLPTILYGIEAPQPSRSTLRMLDNLLNRAVYRMFGCSQSVDIKYIRLMVDLRDLDLLDTVPS